MKCILHIITLVIQRCSANGIVKISDQNLVDQIPTRLEDALTILNIKNDLVTYAICTTCDYVHPPRFKLGSSSPYFPTVCNHIPRPGSLACQNIIIKCSADSEQQSLPTKAFKYHRLQDYIMGLLSRPDIEIMIDNSVDECFANSQNPHTAHSINGFWDGEFVRTFKGPDGKLFIDRKQESRLLFAFNVDFFNVNMVLRRNASTSCGIVSMACLNLPADIRYKPEYMYLAAVIPGPHEPQLNKINHYLRPLIDELIYFWNPGVLFTSTSLSKSGKLVRCAVAICVCDLPAARKVAGLAGPTSHHYCSRCSCCDKDTLGRTDTEHSDWRPRNDATLHEAAKAWSAAATETFQSKLFQIYGIRWSELWRLLYWSPTKQLVTDPMHCLLANLAANHFRNYLGLTYLSTSVAEKRCKLPAFLFEFKEYHRDINSSLTTTHYGEVDSKKSTKDVLEILNDSKLTDSSKSTKLLKMYLPTLKSAAQSLQVTVVGRSNTSTSKRRGPILCKSDYIYCLLEWVRVRFFNILVVLTTFT
jgi:hypothetical protein